MAYIPVTDTEISPEKPITNSLMTKIRDNNLAAIRYGEIMVGVTYNDLFDFTYSTFPSVDGYDVTVSSGGLNIIDLTFDDDWSAINQNSVIVTSSVSDGSGQVVKDMANNKISIGASDDSTISIVIKYDRETVVPA